MVSCIDCENMELTEDSYYVKCKEDNDYHFSLKWRDCPYNKFVELSDKQSCENRTKALNRPIPNEWKPDT